MIERVKLSKFLIGMTQIGLHLGINVMTEEQICNLLKIEFTKRGNTIYIPNKDAQRFVEECRKRQIVIIGIDGMRITDTETRPLWDAMADYSYATDSNASCDDSLQFLSQQEVTLATHFYFVVKEN